MTIPITTRGPTAVPKATANSTAFCRLGASVLMLIATNGAAETHQGSKAASASIDFRIIVPVVLRARTLEQQSHLKIESQHISQGFVDLEHASTIELTSNSRNGYQLSARYDAAVLAKMDVHIDAQHMTATAGAGSMRVHARPRLNAVVRIGYRLYLQPSVTVGEYRWPVALTFAPAMG